MVLKKIDFRVQNPLKIPNTYIAIESDSNILIKEFLKNM